MNKKISRKPSKEVVYCPLCDQRMPAVAAYIKHCAACDIVYDESSGHYVVDNPSTIAKCQRAGYSIIEKVVFFPPAIKIIDCL
jgi:hypothetical protein